MSIEIFSIYLAVIFVFIVLVLRAFYFMFIEKRDPINSVRIPAGSLAAIFKKEKKEEENKFRG